jgi:hypothetical protein
LTATPAFPIIFIFIDKEPAMPGENSAKDFIHPVLGKEITAIGGHYVFLKEIRLALHDREVLYLLGYAVTDTSCCGLAGCAYAWVPGWLKNWKYTYDANRLPVSSIEPVRDQFHQSEIRREIQKREMVQQVTFG